VRGLADHQAKSLRFVDLSDTAWDRKGIDYLVQALNGARIKPPPVPDKDGMSINGTDAGANDTSDVVEVKQTEEAPDEEGEKINEHSAYGSFIPPAPLLREADDETRPAAVQSLRMDGCGLKANVLESLGQCFPSVIVRELTQQRRACDPLILRTFLSGAIG